MIYAQILNNLVVNIIVIDDVELIPLFSEGFDYFIEIDNIIPQPQIDWLYDGNNFSSIILYPVKNGYPSEITIGSNTTFEPFNLSSDSFSFPVKIEANALIIGCQKFDYAWIRYALYMILIRDIQEINILIKTDNGIRFNNKFTIVQSDIDLIYNTLCGLI